jgi:hypothetical protein
MGVVSTRAGERLGNPRAVGINFKEAGSRAVAQAVSHRLPIVAPRFELRSGNVGFVLDKVTLGQVFSEYFGFPCQSSFHEILHHNHRGWHNRPIGGRRAEWTQLDSAPHYWK